jgi:hypothetical protein
MDKPVDSLTDPAEKKRAKSFLARVDASKRVTSRLAPTWKSNVERRIGKPGVRVTDGETVEGEPQSEINPDWSLTKTKTAHLFSQVPTVQGTHENLQYAAGVSPFMKDLNYEIGEKRTRMGVAMEECGNDVVNASGIAALIVGYAARFDTVSVPEADELDGGEGVGPLKTAKMSPDLLASIMEKAKAAGLDIPMRDVQRPTDYRFFVTRISPSDLLWPAEFVGSDYDDADWIGRRGRCSWSEAKADFNLTDKQKAEVISSSEERLPTESLRTEAEPRDLADTEVVEYDELYYWRYRADPNEPSFSAIWKLVFVHGLPDPVVHEPWKGQEYDQETRKYVGNCTFPIRVLTLTYVTDQAVPPSDTAAGRPQVDDLRRSRSQMFMQRKRSMPLRWFDVNRVDPLIQERLMRGEMQEMIPTNGDGSRSVGEIARASYPGENLEFDRSSKADLQESWQVGPDQIGSMAQGRRTGTEAGIVQQNFATRIGQERARVANFFLGAVRVLAGWMVLYSDFPSLTPQEKQAMLQAWDMKHVLHDLVLKIRPDSTVVLDSQARIDRLSKFLNLTAKSGYVNVKPILVEMAELSGLDPTQVIIDPQPQKPENNVSFRFSGKDDIINTTVMAVLVETGQAPSPQSIEKAKQLLAMSAAPPAPPQVGQQLPGSGPGQPPPVGEAHPNWSMNSKIMKRDRDGN